MGNPRLLVIFTLAVAVVLGAVVSLATDSWLFLVLAVVLHAAATAFVLVVTGKRLQQYDKPDPVTEARLEEEGGGDKPKDGRPGDRETVI